MQAGPAVIARVIATVGGVGYCPVAPGTAGTLAALVFFWFVRPDLAFQAAALALVIAVGVPAAHYAERSFGTKDSSQIVIDEVAGYAISVLALPMTPGYLIAAFFLFRFFDIFKPPPARQMDKGLPGGLGIMADDLAAGIYTNVLLQLWRAVLR